MARKTKWPVASGQWPVKANARWRRVARWPDDGVASGEMADGARAWRDRASGTRCEIGHLDIQPDGGRTRARPVDAAGRVGEGEESGKTSRKFQNEANFKVTQRIMAQDTQHNSPELAGRERSQSEAGQAGVRGGGKDRPAEASRRTDNICQRPGRNPG